MYLIILIYGGKLRLGEIVQQKKIVEINGGRSPARCIVYYSLFRRFPGRYALLLYSARAR